MNVLIAYHSKTGNTEKVAKAIHSFDTAWTLMPLESAEPENYDLIFVGGWIHNATFNKETAAFIEKLKGKNVAFFFTVGAYPTSKYAFDCICNIKKLFEAGGNKVLNHFHSQGAVAPEMKQWMQNLTSGNLHRVDKYREIRWAHADTHPNAEDLDAAEFFAAQTAKALNKKD